MFTSLITYELGIDKAYRTRKFLNETNPYYCAIPRMTRGFSRMLNGVRSIDPRIQYSKAKMDYRSKTIFKYNRANIDAVYLILMIILNFVMRHGPIRLQV